MKRGSTLRTATVIMGTVALAGATALQANAIPEPAPLSSKAPAAQRSVPLDHRTLSAPPAKVARARAYETTGRSAALPAPGTHTVTRGPGNTALPVVDGLSLAAPATPAGQTLTVKVLDVARSRALGVNGVAFTVSGPGAEQALPTFDYSDLTRAGGGDYASRLRLVKLTGCEPGATKARPCTAHTLPARRDAHRSLLSAQPTPVRAGSTPAQPVATFALSAGAAGDNGSFAASPLASSGSWSASGATGGFAWSYPIPLPPAATGQGVAPAITLGYNSSSVDGRIAITNNQSSWIGLGWDYEPGFIERSYRPCKDDGSLPAASKTDDLCWAGNVLTMQLPSVGTVSLVRDDTDGSWKAEQDSGVRVQTLPGADNGAQSGEYWRVTTVDGTQYNFGMEALPGAGSQRTNSVLTVPVYGPKSGDPCYSTAGFAQSRCTQAWRWNLDYVVDTNGNAATYTYERDTNYYGPNGSTTGVAYHSASYLSRIEYGLHLDAGSIYGAPAGYRVDFDSTPRCVGTACSTSTDPVAWPDTPIDLKCASGATCDQHAPSFFSTRQLATITTSLRQGATSSYDTVDVIALAQTYPNDGDPSLALSSITRTAHGRDGSTITLPAVTFGYKQWANRVPGVSAMASPMTLQRLSSVSTETGQNILVKYNADEGQASRAKPVCTAATVPAPSALSTNDTACMPVKWTPPYASDPVLDFFHKYSVTEVSVSDRNAAATLAAPRVSTFTYVGDPAWHYDDNELLPAARRMWSQYRGYATVETRTGNADAASNGVADAWTLKRTTYYRGMHGDKLPSDTRNVTLTTSDPQISVTDDNAFTGAVLEEQTLAGSEQLATSITKMSRLKTTATRDRGTELPPLTAALANPVIAKTVTNTPAGSASTMAATTTTAYDAIGRPVRVTEAAANAATRCTGTTYADNPTAWIRDRVAEVSVSAQSCPAVGTAQSAVISRSQTYYDQSATLAAAPSVGNPTMTRQLLSTSPAEQWSKTTSSYDTYGRPTQTVTYPDPTTPATARTTATTYTPADTRPTTSLAVQNAKTQTETKQMDPSRALVTKVIDVGGGTTSATYDALGRVSAVWLPGRTQGTDLASRKFAYRLDETNPQALTTDELVDPGNSAAVTYVRNVKIYNAFGDLRQEQQQTSGGRLVSESFVDSHGWVIRTENGWPTTGGPGPDIISTTGTAIDSRTMFAFDAAGRQVAENSYQGATLKWSTRTIYGGDRTTVIPPTGGVVSTSVVDARGQEKELLKWSVAPTFAGNTYTGGTALTTAYTRDALDRVTAHTVGGVATWTSTYDLGGRVVAATDPDVGNTSTSYNAVGEPVTISDARPQSVTTTYDELGRPLAKFAAATATGSPYASWTYDTYRAGEVATATRRTTAGETFTTSTPSFDAAGRPTRLRYALAETGFKTTYYFDTTYTSTGQVATRTIPATTDGTRGGHAAETLTSFYNALGQPTGTTGNNAYVSNTSYSAWGELTQLTLGVTSSQAWLTYDRDVHSHRVSHVDFSGLAASPQIADWAYTYDNAGNITRLTDVQGASGAATQITCYQYDGLQQLKNAWSSSVASNCGTAPTTANISTTIGGPQPFWHTWTLDANNGRRSQFVRQQVPSGPAATTTGYIYGYTAGSVVKPRALAATTVGPTTVSNYQYNAVGATTQRVAAGVTTSLTYGADGRTSGMTTTGTGGGTTTFINDADGNQLLRRDPGGVNTLFLPGLEIKYTTSTDKIAVTRYYSHAGTTVAMRVGAGNAVYVMPNHQGSVALTYRPSDKTTIRRFLDPYGNKLVADSGTWLSGRGFLDKEVNQGGLVDMGAREYDPTIGRFLSVDPMIDPANPLQHNAYSYANNNPITLSDPSGLRPMGAGDSGCKVYKECSPKPGGGWTYPTPPKGKGGGGTKGGGGDSSTSKTNRELERLTDAVQREVARAAWTGEDLDPGVRELYRILVEDYQSYPQAATCIVGSVGGGIVITGSACMGSVTQGSYISTSGGIGLGTPTISGGIGAQVGNARRYDEMRGGAPFVGGSLGEGFVGGEDYSFAEVDGRTIKSWTTWGGVGGHVPLPGEYHGGYQWTNVYDISR